MPNCDYCATIEDQRPILDFLFEGQECQIYELSSDSEKPLKQFFHTDGILNEFDRIHSTGKKMWCVHLQIYFLGCGPVFKPKKIHLNPKYCDGKTYRYSAEGYGLIQLYLSSIKKLVLQKSHTNHNTKKRAENGAKTNEELEIISEWDFEMITKFSSKLNRFIKKQSAAKIGSWPVLPGALELWNTGIKISSYSLASTEVELK